MHIPRIRPKPRLLPPPQEQSQAWRDADTSQTRTQPRAKLPRDACVTITTDPPELYVSLTIRKPEHLQALLDAISAFAPMLDAELE
jgi:hypothetical protein